MHRVTSLHTIVQEVVRATRPKWQEEAGKKGILIEIVQDLDVVPPIKSSPVELHHVLVCLVSNAVDAMRKGGGILITARLLDDLVAVAVKDQGVGMSAEVQKRIFEPFFTTKHDVGSGLGLSMAYRKVMAWEGRIEVESEPDQGSTFTVFLPVWKEEAQIEMPQQIGTSRGRVLVVDDEEAVHEVLKESLKLFDLNLVSSGEDALEHFEADQYDVALIDLKLPGVLGDEVALKFKQIDPGLITVLMTGWDVLEDDPRKELFDFFVKKPFRLAQMKELVSEAVASRKA
jgi:two-component system cell cycle sensor histidine kinase/response regulator CckA